MATKEKFSSVDELVAVDVDDSSIADIEKELEQKVNAEIEAQKSAVNARSAEEKARAEAEKKAREIELDRINKTDGAADRIKQLCQYSAVAEKLINDLDAINVQIETEIAEIRARYGVDMAEKKAVRALHIVKENLDILKEDYPLIAGDCVQGIVAERLNPVKKGRGSRKERVEFTEGQDVYMSFKGHHFRSVATATGIMLYGNDVANSTAANALADEYEPRQDGRKNNLGAVYWKSTPKTGVEYIDVSH